VQDSIALFRYYKKLAERALEQCPDEGLFAALDPESNSIAIIVKHMVGNMRSRWRNFLTTDGEKPDRNRDSEFEDAPTSRAELMAMWPHSVMQAINRQIAHYSHHIGQVVFAAKHFTTAKTGTWDSLSAPRGHSAQFASDVAAGKKSQP